MALIPKTRTHKPDDQRLDAATKLLGQKLSAERVFSLCDVGDVRRQRHGLETLQVVASTLRNGLNTREWWSGGGSIIFFVVTYRKVNLVDIGEAQRGGLLVRAAGLSIGRT